MTGRPFRGHVEPRTFTGADLRWVAVLRRLPAALADAAYAARLLGGAWRDHDRPRP